MGASLIGMCFGCFWNNKRNSTGNASVVKALSDKRKSMVCAYSKADLVELLKDAKGIDVNRLKSAINVHHLDCNRYKSYIDEIVKKVG